MKARGRPPPGGRNGERLARDARWRGETRMPKLRATSREREIGRPIHCDVSTKFV
ncbi:hypothetical protein BURPS406E_C1758 [Burkholderia pseudomallei 406e]|uniref:Uncharacterized protein n=1 Tax=Burkholderia pseudomallei 1710a TaxID=320371 RepID=A0A0E1VRS5_BURPE|nr:hypothetical protein BURPS668_A1891 [Burkholderia pseudomallei 668]EDO88758.1 hypothetical protein BURPS406E_C1758 [Burkholderia pseudomallei 406e]EDO94534.1 hypothetical protein BURPSPAST_V0190 [Burkholderia pseudomallei Pasteur 52237]EEH25471.1 conserved hypothetical protein [Burkholderia pseudomallei Pakistan 9]EET03558.1 hypothetical protein BURPS1710A_A1041 [Burkholderia pseudomallei 1710a]KGD51060.1 hypothetical protein DP43_4959 [Burkholderia pseudomallei]